MHYALTAADVFISILLFMFWLFCVYLLIRAAVRDGILAADKRRLMTHSPTPATTPQPTGGPVKYRIIGVVRETGAETKTYIVANSIAAASRKAADMGISPTSVEPT